MSEGRPNPNQRRITKQPARLLALAVGAGLLASACAGAETAKPLKGSVSGFDCTSPPLADGLSAMDGATEAMVRTRNMEVQTQICQTANLAVTALVKRYQDNDGQSSTMYTKRGGIDRARQNLYSIKVSVANPPSATVADFAANPDGTPNLAKFDSLTVLNVHNDDAGQPVSGQYDMTVLYHDTGLNTWSLSDSVVAVDADTADISTIDEGFRFIPSGAIGQDSLLAMSQANTAEKILQSRALVTTG